MIALVGALAVITTFSSCAKEKPTADFTIDVTSPVEGQINLKNTSIGATSFLWDFGDGVTSTIESPSHTYSKNGSYVIELTAKNSGGNDSKTRTINIQDVKGSVLFWTNANGNGPISITVNNSYQGQITKYYSSGTPSCGADGCITVRLPEGTYSFKGDDGSGQWTGNVTIQSGGCVTQRLLQ